MRIVNFRSNKIKEVNVGLLNGLTRLQELYLGGNEINMIMENTFN
jgi:hypothetical protein